MRDYLFGYAKKVLSSLSIYLTKNQEYDAYTERIFRKVLKKDSCCIDVGCHKGEILREFIRQAPDGIHFAFEPIPEMYKDLLNRYHNYNKVRIFPYALAEDSGTAAFNHVVNAPAYSGLKKRRYDIDNPEIKQIEVKKERLDEVFPKEARLHLIKIDVEGGELGVIKGGLETIRRHKPVIIFEFGLGASDYYGANAAEIYTVFNNELQMKISTLIGFLKDKDPLSLEAFSALYASNSEYYFIAHSQVSS
jgi:FkbM family methyltransferase